MNFKSFARFFGIGSDKKKKGQRPVTRRRSHLVVEALEDRTLLSTLPAALVEDPRNLLGGHSPQIVADPNNPLRMVLVNASGSNLNIRYSLDGGHNWVNRYSWAPDRDPSVANVNQGFANYLSPSVAFDRRGYFYVSYIEQNAAGNCGRVAVDRYNFNGEQPTFVDYQFLYSWYNTDPAFYTTIAVDTNYFNAATLGTETIFTDSVTGDTQTDTMANLLPDARIPDPLGSNNYVPVSPTPGMVPKGIYVAWNTYQTFTQNNYGVTTNMSRVLMAASGDGGQNYTTLQYVSDAPISVPASGDPFNAAAPRIVFTQGTADGRVTGGVMNVFYQSSINGNIYVDRSVLDGGVATQHAVEAERYVYTGPVSNIIDANSSNVPGVTLYDIDISANPDSLISQIEDLDVVVALRHPNLEHLRIRLITPNGTGITLVRNRMNSDGSSNNPGSPPFYGITGINLGWLNYDGLSPGTVFNQQAMREINNPTASAPYVGHYRPETGNLNIVNGLLRNGTSSNSIVGTWTLEITDYRTDGTTPAPIQYLDNFELIFTGRINRNETGQQSSTFGTDRLVTSLAVNGSYNYTFGANAAGGTPGVGPNMSVVIDNTLGSHSPYQGRMYVAFTSSSGGTNTDVRLAYSDDGGQAWTQTTNYLLQGQTWSKTTNTYPIRLHDDLSGYNANDNFSSGNRAQFMPTLALDPVTGTLVATYYDARYDASGVRTSVMVTTSIDGGETWSTSTFLNLPKTALDAITQENITIEPIPGNAGLAGALGFGRQQGLYAYGGRIVPVFTTNLNANGAEVWTANVTTAAGPRVVYGDMGTITADSTTGGAFYNNTFAADGRRQLDGFVVQFDRPIDPTTFNPSDITVIYRSPTTSPASPGTDISNQITAIVPLDADVPHGNADTPTPIGIYLNDAIVVEGDSGYKNAVFTVLLNRASPTPLSITYNTFNGSGVAGTDYVATLGTLVIPANTTTATITVPIYNNTNTQFNRTFGIFLGTAPAGTVVNRGSATCTIIDNDGTQPNVQPSVNIDDVLVTNAATTIASFTVKLSQIASEDVTVDFVVTPSATAMAGRDYNVLTTTPITILKNTDSATINIEIIGKNSVGPDRTFTVSITGATMATLPLPTNLFWNFGKWTGTCRIVNTAQGAAPTAVSIGDTTIIEGDAGTANAVFTLMLNRPEPVPVSFTYTTANGTGLAGIDYVATSGVVTFAPFSTTATITVPVNGNGAVQGNRTFTVNLSGPPDGIVINRTMGTATIIDNDAATPTVNVGELMVREGDTDANGTPILTTHTLRIFLSRPAPAPVTVEFTVANGTAVAGTDFNILPGTGYTLGAPNQATFGTGAQYVDVNVQVIGNSFRQGDKTFTVTLANPSGATLGKSTGTGIILNDDSLFGATTFLVRLNPQAATGTYSYAIAPLVRDRIRTFLPTSSPTTIVQHQGILPGPVSTFSSTGAESHKFIDTGLFVVESSINVTGFTAGQVLRDLNLNLEINHPLRRKLKVELITPNGGPVIDLSSYEPSNVFNPGYDGANFLNTTFDDTATRSITVASDPSNGSFRPESSRANNQPEALLMAISDVLSGTSLNGTWKLRVTSIDTINTGYLEEWTLRMQAGTVEGTVSLGNFIDQNQNAFTVDKIRDPSDDFAVPNPANGPTNFGPYAGQPFQLPYATDTFPLHLPGAHMVSPTWQAGSYTAPLGLVIPDATGTAPNIVPGVVTSAPITISGIPDGQVISHLRLNLGIEHNRASDLRVTLIGPDGTEVVLFNRLGTTGSHFLNVTFDDTAEVVIRPTQDPYPYDFFTGLWRPVNPFSVFTGKSPNGQWRLKIEDMWPGQTTGRLLNWSLTVDTATVLNRTTNSVDVVFDRDIDANTFTAADILEFLGPLGVVSNLNYTITQNPTGTPAERANRTFRITFMTDDVPPLPQSQPGWYRLTFGADITATDGTKLDNNLNAGLAALRGTDPLQAGQVQNVYGSSVSVPLTAGGTVYSEIDIADVFAILSSAQAPIQLDLDITHPDVRELAGALIAPDNTTVNLFSNLGIFGGGPFANMASTRFDDFATTPIRQAPTPYGFGPFNPLDSLATALDGKASNGIWRLAITNNGAQAGTINAWTLRLPRALLGTGLGEAVADRFSQSFRIFVQNPADSLTKTTWTAVGPATQELSSSTSNARITGRVNAIAVDPSDPSGNTVFVGGGTGGVWKTNNFLTQNPLGPTYIPLTDFGPAASLSIGTIAVAGRNNDANQSIVFVGTGEVDYSGAAVDPGLRTKPGIGLLRSMDGGRTWQVITGSTDNFDPATQAIRSMSDAARTFDFVGQVVNKIVVDPTPLPGGDFVVYMGLSGAGTSNGLWRSTDTGRTWTRLRAGDCSDIILAGGSFDATNGNLQIMYAAFNNEGVYMTTNAPTAAWNSLTIMQGGQGLPGRQNTFYWYTTPLQTNTPPPAPFPAGLGIPPMVNNPTPNGLSGRVLLAAPGRSDRNLDNLVYQGWLYAFVSGGTNPGLYVTKDFGNNWTRIRLPYNANYADPSNDENMQDVFIWAAGNYTFNYMALAIDPNNPNVVYLTGYNNTLRVDIQKASDPFSFVAWDNSDNDGGKAMAVTVGPAETNWDLMSPDFNGNDSDWGVVDPFNPTTSDPRPYQPHWNGEFKSGYYNMIRDPDDVFNATSSFQLWNTFRMGNDGADGSWDFFTSWVDNLGYQRSWTDGFGSSKEMLAIRDPQTGRTRLLLGNEFGIYSVVDNGQGKVDLGIGSTTTVMGERNGNLQLGEFYFGATQPSRLASDIAGALLYAMGNGVVAGRGLGFPTSTNTILSTGNINWQSPQLGEGAGGVATDQTGSGLAYRDIPPASVNSPLLESDFFQTKANNGSPWVGRTTGLLQAGDVPPNYGQWTWRQGSNFAVNPIDKTGIVISAQNSGRIFRTSGPTTGTGLQWFEIGMPVNTVQPVGSLGNVDQAYKSALAFGAPGTSLTSPLHDFIYAGSATGNIFVTFTGGGTGNWKNISGGLDGSRIMAIVTNPKRGTREAFAVTQNGVYWIADSFTGDTWTRISDNTAGGFGDLVSGANRPTRPIFNSTDTEDDIAVIDPYGVGGIAGILTSMVADWRFAIPDDPGNPNGPTHPVLYVGGDGGVFRSLDKGKTWTLYPNNADPGSTDYGDGALQQGGFLPNVRVTDVDLALGNVNPATGFPDPSSGLNMLVATTWGRGEWVIRLNNDKISQYLVTPNPGPRVTALQAYSPTPGAQIAGLEVTFSGSIDPASVDLTDVVTLTGPSGNLTPLSIIDVTPTPPPNQANPHNIWRITFAPQGTAGNYRVVLGPGISDFSGNLMNQNNNATNGENPADRFDGTIAWTPNTPPWLDGDALTPGNQPIPNQQTSPNTPKGPIAFTIGDAETPAAQLTVTATSNNQTLLPNANIALGGSGANRTITMTPATGQLGSATVTVTVTDANGYAYVTTFILTVNNPPTIDTFPASPYSRARTASWPVTFGLTGSDLDPGQTANLVWTANAYDALAYKAYELDQSLGLTSSALATNQRFLNEKYVGGNGGITYFILPTGAFYQLNAGNVQASTLLYTFDKSYYDDTSKLYNATAPSVLAGGASIVEGQPSGGSATLQVNLPGPLPSSGRFIVEVGLTDGIVLTPTKRTLTVNVTNTAPVLNPIANVSRHWSQFPGAPVNVSGTDADGAELVAFTATAYADFKILRAYRRDVELNLYGANAAVTVALGQAKFFQALDGTSYFILSTGEFYQGDGTAGGSTLLETFDGSYFTDPSKVYNAAAPTVVNYVTPTTSPIVPALANANTDLTLTPGSYMGSFAVEVTLGDGLASDVESFQVTVNNTGPNWTGSIANVTRPRPQFPGAAINLPVMDPDGDALTFTAVAVNANPALAGAVVFNFSGGPGTYQMTVDPPNNYVGTFQVQVTASDSVSSAMATFQVTVTNTRPTLAALPNQSGPRYGVTGIIGKTIDLSLYGSDADSDTPLVYTAAAYSASLQGYQLDRSLGLVSLPNNYYYNFRGAGEKYLKGANNLLYFILPDGRFYRWGGSFATSTLLATLPTYMHTNPANLWNAPVPVVRTGYVQVTGNTLTLTPPANFVGSFVVEVTVNDGLLASYTRTMYVTVTNNAPVLGFMPNLTRTYAQLSVPINVPASDPNGDPLTITATAVDTGTLAYNLDRQLGLYHTGNLYQNMYGLNEKWMRSAVNLQWYCILPNGEVHVLDTVNRRIGGLVAVLDSSFWANPAKVYNAPVPSAQATGVTVTVNQLTKQLIINAPVGYRGTLRVTVTVSDGASSVSRTFSVTVI